MKKGSAELDDRKIVVSENGPYIVSGNIPLSIQVITPNREGFSWDWVEGKKFATESEFALCRCGHSKNKPQCDGTHRKINFRAEEKTVKVV